MTISGGSEGIRPLEKETVRAVGEGVMRNPEVTNIISRVLVWLLEIRERKNFGVDAMAILEGMIVENSINTSNIQFWFNELPLYVGEFAKLQEAEVERMKFFFESLVPKNGYSLQVFIEDVIKERAINGPQFYKKLYAGDSIQERVDLIKFILKDIRAVENFSYFPKTITKDKAKDLVKEYCRKNGSIAISEKPDALFFLTKEEGFRYYSIIKTPLYLNITVTVF